jgi:hypothetical protein
LADNTQRASSTPELKRALEEAVYIKNETPDYFRDADALRGFYERQGIPKFVVTG